MTDPSTVSTRFRNPEEEALWNDLRAHILETVRGYSGNIGPERITRIADNWFFDRVDYDGRWAVIGPRLKKGGRVLDMAAGYGTFLLNGLQQGRDAWGLEPDLWKRQFYARKIKASGYPGSYQERLVDGRGECLPFPDRHFDLVTTYQTLEHVADVRGCLAEMLRVLKPGGLLYVRAPDYGGFHEPHYGVPFWPRMNKTLAAGYLKLLGRPLTALRELNWITEKRVIELIQGLPFAADITRSSPAARQADRGEPFPIAVRRWAGRLRAAFRSERQIDLWVKRTA